MEKAAVLLITFLSLISNFSLSEYLIAALYLLLPFYRKISASLSVKDSYYLLGVYFVFLSLMPMLKTLTGKSAAFYLCVYSIYPFYFFLGDAFFQNRIFNTNSTSTC